MRKKGSLPRMPTPTKLDSGLDLYMSLCVMALRTYTSLI
jgi:hypothetical protein